jgi:hypothetical protein
METGLKRVISLQQYSMIEAELRGQVERDREPGLPLGEEVLEALVGLARRAEAGVLPHRPELPAVHGRGCRG